MTPRSPEKEAARVTATPPESAQDTDQLPPVDRLLSTRQVMERVNMGMTTLYRRLGDGTFPRPVRHGQANLWRESVITKWMSELHEVDSQYRGGSAGGSRGRAGRRS